MKLTISNSIAMFGQTEVVDLLLKSGASPSVVNIKVIKHSVKLRQSNIETLIKLTLSDSVQSHD
jgi:hypothetical protein